ncbi:MAG: hypothetical protein RLZZ352_2412 [Pseudomonadota bacterium]|jgi:CRISPR-associated Csx2 family protein
MPNEKITLVSFLGKGVRDRASNAYRPATYQLPGQPPWEKTMYIGQALARHVPNVTKFVILGTASSMWDVFALDMAGDDESTMDALAELELAVREDRVTQVMLDTVAPTLSKRIGCQVCPCLIGYARDAQEQVEVLQVLSEQVSMGDSVVLDVTHGFRHLPMLGLVAARYLQHAREAQTQAIYYGALEMTKPVPPATDGITPVLNLHGMLQMLDWVDALAVYQRTGDYGQMSHLMTHAGMGSDKAQQWKQAAFFERNMAAELAVHKLAHAQKAMLDLESPLVKLFRPALQQRMQWAREPRRALRELALANAYLKRGDYLRGVFYLYECMLTTEVFKDPSSQAQPNDFEARKTAAKTLKERHWPHFGQLEYLRNTLAHGVRSDSEEVLQALKSEEQLLAFIEHLRRVLKPSMPTR